MLSPHLALFHMLMLPSNFPEERFVLLCFMYTSVHRNTGAEGCIERREFPVLLQRRKSCCEWFCSSDHTGTSELLAVLPTVAEGLEEPILDRILTRNSAEFLWGCAIVELFLFFSPSFSFLLSKTQLREVVSYSLDQGGHPVFLLRGRVSFAFAWEVFSGTMVKNGTNNMTFVA